MLHVDPDKRPNVEQALMLWHDIRRNVRVYHQASRLHTMGETTSQIVILDAIALVRLVVEISRRYIIRAKHWFLLLRAGMQSARQLGTCKL